MGKIYKKKCKYCKNYYEGFGKIYCSRTCGHLSGTEYKFKIGNKVNLGRVQSNEERLNRSKIRMGYKHSIEIREKMSRNNLGYRSHFWKGGVSKISKKLRECLRYKIWRELVYKRDNYICVECGDNQGGNLNADHYPIPFYIMLQKAKNLLGIKNLYEKILKFDLFWNINNGRTLCLDCHKNTDTWGRPSVKN